MSGSGATAQLAGGVVLVAAIGGAAGCTAVLGIDHDYGVRPGGDASDDGGGTFADGGADANDALVSDPDHISCGSASCPIANDYCCFPAVPGPPTCFDQCTGHCNGLHSECDETAQCASTNEVCCLEVVRPFGFFTTCETNCQGYPGQACRTNAECPGGQPCVPWTCAGTLIATCGAAGIDAGCK